jgi:hypothetical protein
LELLHASERIFGFQTPHNVCDSRHSVAPTPES